MNWRTVADHTIPQLIAIAKACRRKSAHALADAALAASAPHAKKSADHLTRIIKERGA